MRFLISVAAGAVLSIVASVAAAAAQPAATNPPAASALASATGEPMPKFGPAGAWVRREPVPAGGEDRKDEPFNFRLMTSQERLTPTHVENFVEYVVQPLNQAGLQAVGTITIPWNVNRADLTLNRVDILREGKTIDALRKEDVSVIRRESGLEKSTLTGIRTVVLPVRGLQAGDELRVAFTYNVKTTLGATEEIQDFNVPFRVGRAVKRFVIDKGLPVRWSVDPSIKESSVAVTPAGTERVFVGENLEPVKERSFVPGRFRSRLIQVTAFESWQQVADPLIPLFEKAATLDAGSSVATLAEKIAAEHSDPEARMLAALRAAQDEVRYVALLLGDGDYTPMSADEVWSRRFGDCKGKTVLLLALLDRLGIAAEPMLASVQLDDGLERRLPSLVVFDHVYVRARIGGETYYLDGTLFGQRTLEELKVSPTRHGLPLAANSSLVTVADVLPSKPLQESLLVWNAAEGVTGDVPFEATLTLRGPVAAAMRAATVSSTDREKLVEGLKSKVPGVANDDLELVSTEAEEADGSYVVRFNGTAEIDWAPVDGLKGNRMQLSQSTLRWDGEFDRDGGEGQNIPVLISFPYWERSTEKVILPDGGKDFRLDAKAIDRTIAATRISRSIEMKDGVITAVNDFKHLHRELDADQARAAKPELESISEDYAYVVAKRRLKLAE